MCRGLFKNILTFLLASYALAKPVDYDLYASDDVAAVESLHHQVRVLPPAGFARQKDLDSESTSPEKRMKNASGQSEDSGYYKTYGSDAEGEKGYLKRTHGKGDHGYKTFDTFHKQDGDKYGYEEHITYGRAKDGHGGGSHGKSESYSAKQDDHDGAGTIIDSHYVDGDGKSGHYEGGDYDEGASSHYTKGGEGDHYEGGEYDHHSEGGGSRNYNYGDGHGENYSTGGGGGENGSYETHSSYSSGSDGGGNYGGSHY